MRREKLFIVALLLLQGASASFNLRNAAFALSSEPQVFVQASYVLNGKPDVVASASRTPTAISRFAAPAVETPAPPVESEAEAPLAERALVVSFDGMRPDAIAAAPMPNLLRLMQSSAYSLTARTISYPTTLPSHTSMLSGMCMDKHGLGFNSRNLYRGYARGADIFDLLHEAGMKSVMVVAKDKLEQIPAPGTVDVFETFGYEVPIAEAAVGLMPDDFDFMFLHFPSADLTGHKRGWMSNTQLHVLSESDKALQKVLDGLDANGMRETTLVIVTADHGGHDRTHDGTQLVDYLIPWIVSGPGVIPGELQSPVKIMDTAATIAYALGLPVPGEWDGVPVLEVFGRVPQDVHYRVSPCE